MGTIERGCVVYSTVISGTGRSGVNDVGLVGQPVWSIIVTVNYVSVCHIKICSTRCLLFALCVRLHG